MPPLAIVAALAGTAGVGGALAGRASARTQTTKPIEDPAYAGLKNMLIQQAQSRLSNPSALPPEYETGGISNINNIYDIIRRTQANNLTARGLSTSPVASAVTGRTEDARAGNIAQFSNQIPLLNQQLGNEDFMRALQVFNMQKTGTSTVLPGSPLGGAVSDIGSMLGFLAGKGMLGKGLGA